MISRMATRARLRLLATLSRRDAREREGRYLLEGARLVAEALAAGAPVEELYFTGEFATGAAGMDLLERAAAARIGTERLPGRELARLAATRTPQGVVAVVRSAPADPAALRTAGLSLALDGVSDPGNVGTLVRAADAFGAGAVLAGPGTADFRNGKVLRAAMGSTFHVGLFPVPDLAAALLEQRRAGALVVAAVLDGEDLYELSGRPERVCLVLGNEARGVSPAVLRVAARRVTIPCPGRAESLNVAMAGAIALSRLARR
jgi:TrmH family RNA methyltransferase